MLCIGMIAVSLGLLVLVGSDRSFRLPPRHEGRYSAAVPHRPKGEEVLG
ncbi:hypothetical protein JHL17_07240 [Azospirillum sp. YIM B02556]|uniref:Uncharacterized protein n=1 Tax=Azospirillum endophyticum TaxID=2800326 RepID=A0ABS1F1A6_9PROT|nr:hypothetical protein [Azospirillum endophyticum]MBK1837203.1 hypothetical protein [Azospirillum endophyticum]